MIPNRSDAERFHDELNEQNSRYPQGARVISYGYEQVEVIPGIYITERVYLHPSQHYVVNEGGDPAVNEAFKTAIAKINEVHAARMDAAVGRTGPAPVSNPRRPVHTAPTATATENTSTGKAPDSSGMVPMPA